MYYLSMHYYDKNVQKYKRDDKNEIEMKVYKIEFNFAIKIINKENEKYNK